MYDFHLNRFEYFKTQITNTNRYVIPFIESSGYQLDKGQRVLEIGCAEGGVLKAFVDRTSMGIGVERDALRVEQANEYLKDEIQQGKITIYQNDIFDPEFATKFAGRFDLIVLKDVIEHIHGQEKLLHDLQAYLAPKGKIFLGFPPWRMPFGGHQQVCRSKFLSRSPWIHLLPKPIYKSLLLAFKEKPDWFMDTRETGISIARFEKIARSAGYTITGTKHYLINPIYEFKFGWKPKEQYAFIQHIPYFRDFLTTCVYYLIEKK